VADAAGAVADASFFPQPAESKVAAVRQVMVMMVWEDMPVECANCTASAKLDRFPAQAWRTAG